MRFNIIFLFAIILFYTSCSKHKEITDEIKTIHLKESSDILPISTFIKELDYLELNISSVNAEIGEIQDLKVFDNDIVVKHGRAGVTNFIRFSKDGKFINNLTKNTKQKEIIPNPSDIIQHRKDYAVMEANGVHVISKDGKYEGKLLSGDMPGNVFFSANNKFFALNNSVSSEFLCELGNLSDQKTTNVLDDERISNTGYMGIASQGKDNLHLFSYLNDTVFLFSKNRLYPKYVIDGNPYPTFIKVLQNAGERDQLETLKYIHNTQYVVVKNYLENKNFIFISYWIGSNSSNLIINKNTWEILYFARAVNNIDGGIWDKAMYLSDDDELYIPISSYKTGGHKISDKKNKEFEKLQARIQASGNPVIMRCKLK